MSQEPSCWCGNTLLEPFSTDYLRCASCETLVIARMPAPEYLLVDDDARDFYGRQYFKRMTEEHGLPPIEQRSRTDLPERCIYWLRDFLKYKLPPGRILELGCAHGGFVALLRRAGFDATGLELSPWLADFARKTFDVPVLVGPVESQDLAAGSLDAVVLMDVLEHLGNPAATLSRCLSLLKSDGIFFLQTPRYREGKTLREMEDEKDPFLDMLKPDQHLYLFSKSSLRFLFQGLGVKCVSFEPAIFGSYDMAAVAGRNTLACFSEDQVASRMESCSCGRIPLALLDLDKQLQELRARNMQCEADSAARLKNNDILDKLLVEAHAACASQIGQIETLERWLAEARSGSATEARERDTLENFLAATATGAALASRLEAEQARVREYETLVQSQNLELRELSQEVDKTSAALATRMGSEQGRVRQYEALIQSQSSQQAAFEVRCADLRERLAEATSRAASFQALYNAEASRLSSLVALRNVHSHMLDRVRGSHMVRLIRKFGLWGWLDSPSPSPTQPEAVVTSLKRGLKRVVVDLTPVLPGGENGGAKVMTLELLRHLGRMAPECEFILLTSSKSHNELASLDSRNIRRMCVNEPGRLLNSADRLADRSRRLLQRFIPAKGLAQLGKAYRGLSTDIPTGRGLLRKLDADLLFSPFTAPYFFDPTVPAVSVVYDLQHVYCPQFFEPTEVQERSRNFNRAYSVSNRIVCISDYVRQTVLETSAMLPEQVKTIHISLPRRLQPASEQARERVLKSFELRPLRYLLYPANFWPHKNHELLLTAFGMYRSSNPGSGLKLVLTGSPSRRRDDLIEACRGMGLSEAVVFPGYLETEEFSALMEQCLALIFPSLFEGFGMPLVEAMAARRPILCSTATSLPEVAGDAALFFNAMKPAEIVAAIQGIEQDPDLQRALIEKGTRRLSAFGGPEEMATRYLRVFHEAIDRSSALPPAIFGIFDDGWVGERATVVFGRSVHSRELVLKLAVPEWVPVPTVELRLSVEDEPVEAYTMRPGEVRAICRSLPVRRGFAELTCSPVFQPSACGMGEDSRTICCRCQSAEIVSVDGTILTLTGRTYAM